MSWVNSNFFRETEIGDQRFKVILGYNYEVEATMTLRDPISEIKIKELGRWFS